MLKEQDMLFTAYSATTKILNSATCPFDISFRQQQKGTLSFLAHLSVTKRKWKEGTGNPSLPAEEKIAEFVHKFCHVAQNSGVRQ